MCAAQYCNKANVLRFATRCAPMMKRWPCGEGGRLLGDGGIRIHRVRPLDRAGPDALSFAVSVRYAADLDSSKAGAVLVPEALASGAGPGTRIVVPDPYGALVQVLHALYPRELPEAGIDPTARIGTGAVIGPEVSIGPFVVLGQKVEIRSIPTAPCPPVDMPTKVTR